MSKTFPDHETVRAAMALATRAPSVHNTQPWRWRIGAHSMHLYAEQSLHLAHTDPDGRDLLISCGAALHHAAVALYALGDVEPRIHADAYIHPDATVIGNVTIGADSTVWPHTVLRGD